MDKFEEHDPRYFARETKGQWCSDPQDIALARAPAFAQRFFAEVFNEFPELAAGVVFLRLFSQRMSTRCLTCLVVGFSCRSIRSWSTS